MLKTNRKAVVTGSTGNIGKAIAMSLAGRGWDLIFLNRSEDKNRALVKAFRKKFPAQSFWTYTADMLDLHSLLDAADCISRDHPSINGLYNIAGVLSRDRVMSVQNQEAHFTVNTLSPYLLIRHLQPSLAAGADSEPSCIVNMTSGLVKKRKTLDVEGLPDPKTIGGVRGAYRESKTALNLVGEILKDQLFQEHIYIYSVDPGLTMTAQTQEVLGLPKILRPLLPLFFKPIDANVDKVMTSVKAAMERGDTGLFISRGRVQKMPPVVVDSDVQNDLRALLRRLDA